ncbi:MAG: SCP2 sterol-binding domain-containing protein [Desulfurococcales archaeon]|nr:SCP2 sterol-binding domain-containing protein [Desulfurococcales archaeon]
MALEEYQKSIAEIFEKAKAKVPEISNWNKVYQFETDEGDQFYIEISGGELKIVEGKHSSPIATLKMPRQVLDQVLKGELDAMKAFMTGKMKITGNVFDTANLRKMINAGLGKE